MSADHLSTTFAALADPTRRAILAHQEEATEAARKAKPQAQPKAPTASASKAFNRLKTGLTRMGDKRPRKLASFLRHVQAILGKDSPAAAVEAAVRELERAKVLVVVTHEPEPFSSLMTAVLKLDRGRVVEAAEDVSRETSAE